MGTIRLSNDFVSPAISKADPKITLNQKPHQQITAVIESHWDQTVYNNSFELSPQFLKNKLHLYVKSDPGYVHGKLSWEPNTFVNGSDINYDLTVNVTDAMDYSHSIPSGYDDYYLHDSRSNLYEDINYDNYVNASKVSGKVIVFDVDNYLLGTTSMNSMFDGNKTVTELDLSNLNTSNITNMSRLFASCESLQFLDITNFDTSKVTNMSYMFSSCNSLTSLDLSNFNTQNTTSMSSMFSFCGNIVVLDLSNFDTSKVNSTSSMFTSNSMLQYLIIGSNTFKFQLKASEDLPSTCKILVPSALISTYQNATNWSAHASKFDAIENYNIVRSNGQVTVTPKNA